MYKKSDPHCITMIRLKRTTKISMISSYKEGVAGEAPPPPPPQFPAAGPQTGQLPPQDYEYIQFSASSNQNSPQTNSVATTNMYSSC